MRGPETEAKKQDKEMKLSACPSGQASSHDEAKRRLPKARVSFRDEGDNHGAQDNPTNCTCEEIEGCSLAWGWEKKVSASPQPWPLLCSSSPHPSRQPLETKDRRVRVGLMGVTRRGVGGVRGQQGEGITSWSSGPASLPDTFTGPSLWAEPGTLIPEGTNVSLWCRGPAGAKQYHVLRRSECRSPSWPWTEVEFPISPVTREDAGHYCCRYWIPSRWSQCSHPLELVVTGIYEKPALFSLSGPFVGTGEDVTLQCKAKSRFDRFALYKEGDSHISIGYEWRSQANFPIPAVNRTHKGAYRCYTFSSDSPYHWSAPSDPLELIVTETSPRPGTQDDLVGASSGLPKLWERILMGVSLLLASLFLFFLLLYHLQHLLKPKPEGREEEDKETLKSFSPTGAMQEQTLYTAVKNSIWNRPGNPTAGDLQEVTYTQLIHQSPGECPACAPPHRLCPTGPPMS
ncbi:LOW QUALITY PROTEIN: mast cell surface glycoprotein Gp49A-like [Trichosurus vulpecula]|uniref:LOW QUALITY PROTEIN: mast cell surface glycoprotein Gp49A-like n=1 Tax=Trichosurus vulpecula TaxID=9337 RepID=UPI00186AFBC7|nr:LOW QUALITY PROTEIN: mast cell surface glycoprotein Gp49A-like [Trichosurus vulpecula]